MDVSDFRTIIFLDAEFRQPDGERVEAVHALVAHDSISGQWWEYGPDDIALLKENPLPAGDDALYVGFALSAEWGAFLHLGWTMPKYCIDLHYEWKRWRNGKLSLPDFGPKVGPNSLVCALRTLGIPFATSSAHKDRMRDVCKDNVILPREEVPAILAYCREDVRPLQDLFEKLRPSFGEFDQALFRGKYSQVEARIDWAGIPMDAAAVGKIAERTPAMIAAKVESLAAKYSFFNPTGRVNQKAFAAWLVARDYEWWRTEGGDQLATDEETFGKGRDRYPELEDAYQLVRLISTLAKVSALPIGRDGRCRYYQNPFSTVTGRHAGKINPYILPKWVRSLIKPREGEVYITADWKAQEIGIAAYLSGDERMKAVFDVARDGGDVYMKFAEMANLVPPGARREDYESVRKNCKVVFLAANYGGGPMSTAAKLGIAMGEATRLHQLYNETFSTYRDWTQVVVNFALQACYLETWLGWRYIVEGNRPKPGRPYSPFPNDRALANWPIQAAGADLMRLAALEATHQGLDLVATVHDALIIVAPEGEADAHAAMLRQIMDQVPMAHLGMPAVVDMTVTRFPDRYVDSENPGAWAEVARGFGVG